LLSLLDDFRGHYRSTASATGFIKPVDAFFAIFIDTPQNATLGNAKGLDDLCLSASALDAELCGEHAKSSQITFGMLKHGLRATKSLMRVASSEISGNNACGIVAPSSSNDCNLERLKVSFSLPHQICKAPDLQSAQHPRKHGLTQRNKAASQRQRSRVLRLTPGLEQLSAKSLREMHY
jgi:hypothetical protein